MEINRAYTIAFTGNRDLTSPDGVSGSKLCDRLRTELFEMLEQRYAQGYKTFLTGMAIGWDMLAAEVVLELRQKHCDIRLIAIVPFEGQQNMYRAEDSMRYEVILEAADYTHTVWSGAYNRFVYHLRNDFLVANSSVMIAYDCGNGGGATSTISKASKKGLRVINLYDTTTPMQLDFGW
ncbi:MAG: SLOG family protein [Rikenellaceae bacterium]